MKKSSTLLDNIKYLIYGVRYILQSCLRTDKIKKTSNRLAGMENFAKLTGFKIQNPFVVWPDEGRKLTKGWHTISNLEKPISDRQYFLYSLAKSMARPRERQLNAEFIGELVAI